MESLKDIIVKCLEGRIFLILIRNDGALKECNVTYLEGKSTKISTKLSRNSSALFSQHPSNSSKSESEAEEKLRWALVIIFF